MDQSAELMHLVADYRPPLEKLAQLRDLRILLLVGPAGVGKDSLKRKLLETNKYYELVSHTTRPPRFNGGVFEYDGVDYYFVSKERMLDMARSGLFLQVKAYSTNFYGTSLAELCSAVEQERVAITDVDVQGALEFTKFSFQQLTIAFLLPPSFEEWVRRLSSRYSTEEDRKHANIPERMAIGLNEIRCALNNPEHFSLFVNDDLSSLAEELNLLRGKRSANRSAVAARTARVLISDIGSYLGTEGSGTKDSR